MARQKHPKPEVEEALRYAEEFGWRVETGRSHWGILKCPFFKDSKCNACAEWCSSGIWSSPRNPGTHARQIKRKVDRCMEYQQAKQENEKDE